MSSDRLRSNYFLDRAKNIILNGDHAVSRHTTNSPPVIPGEAHIVCDPMWPSRSGTAVTDLLPVSQSRLPVWKQWAGYKHLRGIRRAGCSQTTWLCRGNVDSLYAEASIDGGIYCRRSLPHHSARSHSRHHDKTATMGHCTLWRYRYSRQFLCRSLLPSQQVRVTDGVRVNQVSVGTIWRTMFSQSGLFPTSPHLAPGSLAHVATRKRGQRSSRSISRPVCVYKR